MSRKDIISKLYKQGYYFNRNLYTGLIDKVNLDVLSCEEGNKNNNDDNFYAVGYCVRGNEFRYLTRNYISDYGTFWALSREEL